MIAGIQLIKMSLNWYHNLENVLQFSTFIFILKRFFRFMFYTTLYGRIFPNFYCIDLLIVSSLIFFSSSNAFSRISSLVPRVGCSKNVTLQAVTIQYSLGQYPIINEGFECQSNFQNILLWKYEHKNENH